MPTWQAPNTDKLLLSCVVKLHYNWNYSFLRPSKAKIIERYNRKFRPTIVARHAAAATAATAVAAAAAAPPTAAAAAAAPTAAAGPSGVNGEE